MRDEVQDMYDFLSRLKKHDVDWIEYILGWNKEKVEAFRFAKDSIDKLHLPTESESE